MRREPTAITDRIGRTAKAELLKARRGFIGGTNSSGKNRDPGGRADMRILHGEESPLETNDNSEKAERDYSAEIADPATIEDNVIYTLQRVNEHAQVFKKLFRAS